MSGFFITFEGGEGVGKSTQAQLLAGYLEARGYAVILTREPGGTPCAEAIRHLLLTGQAAEFGPLAEFFLFIAGRVEHVQQVIAPALETGKIVICDRFLDSTIVYQQSEQVSRQLIDEANEMAIGKYKPHITFLLDLPAEETAERCAKRGAQTFLDSEETSMHQARRERYLALAAEQRERIYVLDARRPVEEIAVSIQLICEEWLKKNNEQLYSD